MQRYQEQGLVLHTRPYRESSAIISVLTEKSGLLRGVLRGHKKSSLKNFAPVRPLSLVSFSFSGSSELKTMYNMDMIRSYARVPARMSYGMLLAEICHKLLPPEQEEEGVYVLLLETLRRLDTQNAQATYLVTNFILDFLFIQGYELEMPEFALDHLMSKSQNAGLSQEEKQALLEKARNLLRIYYPGKPLKTFNLLMSTKHETRG